MRLINARTFALEEFLEDKVPPYAILSHTWEDEEVSFRDMQDLETARLKKGFRKIEYTCVQALKVAFRYAWVDTCEVVRDSLNARPTNTWIFHRLY